MNFDNRDSICYRVVFAEKVFFAEYPESPVFLRNIF